jgi:regulator of PEP synthase PpsR (kinase-PPPase family)
MTETSDKQRTVFFISGNTAITAETMGMGLLSQFDHIRFTRITLPFINTVDKAKTAVRQINSAFKEARIPPIVFSTLVDEEIRRLVMKCDCEFIDFFDAFLGPLEKILGAASSHTVGRYHGLDDIAEYDSRLEAINYSLGSDDGVSTQKYNEADVILLGVSRTGKTPTCLYLAFHYGIWAANYPLTEENLTGGVKLPSVLIPYQSKLCGLTIAPDRLEQIRSRRRPGSRYSSLAQCRSEIAQAESIFAAAKIPFINVTSMSVEEIAVTIMAANKLPRR